MPDEKYFPTIRLLAEYEVSCNSSAIDAARSLHADQLFQTFPFGHKTIHATLFHTVEVFQMCSGCVGPAIVKPPMVAYQPKMSLGRLAEWNAESSEAFLRAIDESHSRDLLALDRRLVQLFHLVTHGSHHRAQFITMLRLIGRDPPFEAGDFGGWSRGR